MDIKLQERIARLFDTGNTVNAYVYKKNGFEEYWFENTPENIASFLARHPDAREMVLTDQMDQFILNTIGFFIDRCPDQELLEKIKVHLIPMQLQEREPYDFFCPTDDEVEEYFAAKSLE